MKKGAGVHCARAVHVQIFCTCWSFAAPTGQAVRAADAKLAGHMYAIPAMLMLNDTGWWGAWCTCARARAQIQRRLPHGTNPPLILNITLSTILAQGSAIKQCQFNE